MSRFTFTVEIEAETAVQVAQVMSERLGYDETYDDDTTGEPFDYTIWGWSPTDATPAGR